MSQNDENLDLQHDIVTWEDDMCAHLLPYWREVFRKNSIAENYDNIMTPPYCSIQTKTVELIFYLCDFLKQPQPVYFLTVDIFDNFLANHVSDMWKSVEKLQRKPPMIKFSTYWEFISSHIKEQLLLRVLSCIQLASKMIYSPHQVTAGEVKDILKKYKQHYELKAIIQSEFRVFRTLHFKLPATNTLECLELLIQQSCPPYLHNELHKVAAVVLKFCYMQMDKIKKVRENYHPTVLSACALLISNHLQRLVRDKDALLAAVSQATSTSTHVLSTYTEVILKAISD